MRNEKLKIAFVIQDLYRLGAQYVTSLLAKGLANRGHQVDVVVSGIHEVIGRQRPELNPFPVPDNVGMVQLPQLKASRNIFALAQYFKQRRPDVVMPMSSNYEPACALALCLLPKTSRPRFMPVEHLGGIGMSREASRVGGNTHLLGTALSWLIATLAEGAIAVSQGVADALEKTGKYPREKISVIYNPVIDDAFFEKKAEAAVHPWLMYKTSPVIIAAGAHVPLKGFDLLLRAISLVQKDVSCRLILFGEGPQTESLGMLAKNLNLQDKVSFPGHTHNLPSELKHADVFVVSSHCESFSVVLVEALACGVPVVSTDCPSGPREILRNGMYGTLVQPDDPQALADGIKDVLMGKGASPVQESWAPFTLEEIVERYEQVLLRPK